MTALDRHRLRLHGSIMIWVLLMLFLAWPAFAQPQGGGEVKSEDSLGLPPVSPGELGSSGGAKNEVSVSGDYLYGQGYVTLPSFYSLQELGAIFPTLHPQIESPDRNSDYVGATLSYSRGRAWYLDLSYAHGSSSGTVAVEQPPPFPPVDSAISIDDDWYQACIRYAFPRLRTTPFFAYLRAGISYVETELIDSGEFRSLGGFYDQRDKTKDILGNIGFGLGHSLYTGDRSKLALQLEGEGFYGHRSQNTQETVNVTGLPTIAGPTVSIDNDLYGGIGRLTLRFQYALGRTGLFKIFADGGIQVKCTFIDYGALGTPNELLWGPYVKAGLRYSF